MLMGFAATAWASRKSGLIGNEQFIADEPHARLFCRIDGACAVPPDRLPRRDQAAQGRRPFAPRSQEAPCRGAIDLLKGKKAKEGLAMAREAQAVPNKNAL